MAEPSEETLMAHDSSSSSDSSWSDSDHENGQLRGKVYRSKGSRSSLNALQNAHILNYMEQIYKERQLGTESPPLPDKKLKSSSNSSIKSKIHRLFGRERPVYQVLGGGNQADLFLWRDKKATAAVLGGATAIWVLFELIEYHLLTLICHSLILTLAILLLWSNAITFINKSPPHIPQVNIPEGLSVNVAVSLRFEINRALATLRGIAIGRDLKKFLVAIAGLWVFSTLGSCFSFLTLSYIVLVLLHTVPFVYEKYEDKVDSFGQKSVEEIKKQYAVFDAKVLRKIPIGALKNTKNNA